MTDALCFCGTTKLITNINDHCDPAGAGKVIEVCTKDAATCVDHDIDNCEIKTTISCVC